MSIALTSCAQQDKYPGVFKIRGYKIGDKVDKALFKKEGDIYFPNYLDGWTMNNVDELPSKYRGLPVAVWQLKSDSSIVLTLLDDIVLNITVSFMEAAEKDSISNMAAAKFGFEGKQKTYQESHPFQSYVTYWDLKTWETNDVIFQTGNSDLRNPRNPAPRVIKWNLVYSDFILEGKIIDAFRERK